MAQVTHGAPFAPHAAAFVALTQVSPLQQPAHDEAQLDGAGGTQRPDPSLIRPEQHFLPLPGFLPELGAALLLVLVPVLTLLTGAVMPPVTRIGGERFTAQHRQQAAQRHGDELRRQTATRAGNYQGPRQAIEA